MATTSLTSEYQIEDPEQLRVLAVPSRLRVMTAFGSLGTATVNDVASHVGRSAESLYFHVRALEECGLLLEAGERVSGGRSERLYRPVAEKIRIAGDITEEGYRGALSSMCGAIARASEREYSRSLESDRARLLGAGRNLAMYHYHVHLKGRDRQRLLRMLEEINTFIIEHNDPANGELYSYGAIFSPVAGRGHSTQRKSDA
ncbi:MAG: hypothetical protein ACYTF7_03640 [Planctomycetota bacterium]|jgi:DNA-binding transcriptional ArsR family regulator